MRTPLPADEPNPLATLGRGCSSRSRGLRALALALVTTLGVGFAGCGHTAGNDSETSTAQPRSDESGPRPWTGSERRYCPIAGMAMPVYVQYVSDLSDDSVENRAAAAAALGRWNSQLRRSAPREIAEAVQTLTAISDRALDLNAAELEDALAAPTAQRAYEQHASYLREHCGISFGGSDESGHRPHG